jgi:hypothetical protein
MRNSGLIRREWKRFAPRGNAKRPVQRYLALLGWGFLLPFAWGFSAKWMRVLLGQKAIRPRVLFAAVALNFLGVACAGTGQFTMATILLFVATLSAVLSHSHPCAELG